MTAQEAITELLTDKLCIMAVASHPSLVNVEEIGIAISALEKQIPKKVTKSVCPSCHRIFLFKHGETRKGNYCDNCGQALDWSDAE